MRYVIPIVIALAIPGAAPAAEPRHAAPMGPAPAEAAWVKWKPKHAWKGHKHAWKGNRGRHLGWVRGRHRGWYR